MALHIPEGEAFLPGRGRDQAVAALKAAEAAGLEPGVVRTVSGGYLVPEALLDHYEGEATPEVHPEAPDADDDGEADDDAEVTTTNAGVGHGLADHSSQPGGADGETLAQSALESRTADTQPIAVTAPAKSAGKGAWVEFAVSQGATEEDALAQTKDQLIEQYGSNE